MAQNHAPPPAGTSTGNKKQTAKKKDRKQHTVQKKAHFLNNPKFGANLIPLWLKMHAPRQAHGGGIPFRLGLLTHLCSFENRKFISVQLPFEWMDGEKFQLIDEGGGEESRAGKKAAGWGKKLRASAAHLGAAGWGKKEPAGWNPPGIVRWPPAC